MTQSARIDIRYTLRHFLTRPSPACALAAVLLVATARVAPAQEPGPTPAAAAFADALARTGWGGASIANGAGLAVRSVPLCSQGMLDAVAAPERLPEAARAALREVARVTCTEPGFWMAAEIPAGTHALGIERTGGVLQFVLRQADGRELAREPFWIGEPTDAVATSMAMGSGGGVDLHLSVGGIGFAWRYISRATHDAATAAPQVVTSGRVVLATDLPVRAVAEALAAECDAALAAHARLLGVAVPEGPYRLHVTGDAARFARWVALLGEGADQDRGAWTARLTGCSYVWYVPLHDAPAFADHGATLRMRAICLHELGHLVAYRSHRGALAWPTWLAEGLAELGTLRALDARAKDEAAIWLAGRIGVWQQADAFGGAPSIEDLLVDPLGGDRSAGYAAALGFARHLDTTRPGGLAALCAALDEVPVANAAAPRAMAVVERDFGPVGTLHDATVAAMRAAPREPAVRAGDADRVAEGWRIAAPPEGQARLALPLRAAGPALTVETRFAWHPAGQAQADLYLGYREGARATRFVKVAVLPDAICCFGFRAGAWATWGRVAYEKPLAIGEPGKPVWHPLTVRYAPATAKLRVETTGGRWAEFDCPEPVPIAGTQVAIGTFGGIVRFGEVKIR